MCTRVVCAHLKMVSTDIELLYTQPIAISIVTIYAVFIIGISAVQSGNKNERTIHNSSLRIIYV